MTTTRGVLVCLGAMVVVVALAAGLVVHTIAVPGEVASVECVASVPLSPRVQPGFPWQQHRHALVSIRDPVLAGDLPSAGISYLVRNQRTGQMFRWTRRPAHGGGASFLVPTRYAELINRRWEDDPWAYCLVRTPASTPGRRAGGYETSASTSFVVTSPGQQVEITASVTATHEATVLVDIEVSDPGGVTVNQAIYDQQMLTANAARSLVASWRVPADALSGLYSIRIGVFAPGWSHLYHWNDRAAVVIVQSPARDVR